MVCLDFEPSAQRLASATKHEKACRKTGGGTREDCKKGTAKGAWQFEGDEEEAKEVRRRRTETAPPRAPDPDDDGMEKQNAKT